MGVYDGIQYLRSKKAKISIVPLAMDASILDCSEEQKDSEFRIEINCDLPLEEQVKSLIHEILHCGSPYRNYLGRGISLFRGTYSEFEEKIENLTEQVYSCQPRLTDWLR